MIENIKAVAADIDMTLSAKGGDLPEVTKKAFRILQDHGVQIGLATGRELNERLYTQWEFWHMDRPFDFLVGMNGGQLWDKEHGNFWNMELMQPETMKEILTDMMDIIEPYEVSVNVEGGGNHGAMYIKGELFESMKRRGWVFEDYTGDIDGFCKKPCFKILFRTTPEVEKMIRQRIAERWSDRFQAVGTFPGTVEMIEKSINKGSGLARYAEMNHIDMKDIIAFGDNENDDPMMIQAGWGVCLLNGAQKSKDCADDVTEQECEEGGVCCYLRDHYLIPKGLWEE